MKKNKGFSQNAPAYLEKTFGSRLFDTINLILLLIIAASCILPIWYTLCVSVSDKAAVAAGAVTLWPKGFTLTSYNQLMDDNAFFVSFFTSVKRVLVGTVITISTIVLLAYPLSKSNKTFPFRNAIMWLLVFCMLFNGGLVPWFETMKNLKMTNSVLGLALCGGLPVFNVILVMNFYRNLPKEMEEAAVVDGAGPWVTLFQIVIPVSKPVIATVVLFTAVGHWNEFFNGLILSSGPSRYPLQTYIQQMVVDLNDPTLTAEEYIKLSTMSNQTLNAAKLFIAMIPVLVIYPFLQKYFITGITLGSVKE